MALAIVCLGGLPPMVECEGTAAAGDPKIVSAPPAQHPRTATLFKRQWGIELLGVRLASAGYMLDFRYRVLDARKAQPLFLRRVHPLLIDEATGSQLIVPAPAKVGPLRNSDPPRVGRVYWIFFANPGKLVKSGDRVTVVIGDFRAEGQVVK